MHIEKTDDQTHAIVYNVSDQTRRRYFMTYRPDAFENAKKHVAMQHPELIDDLSRLTME